MPSRQTFSHFDLSSHFQLPLGSRSYSKQYAQMYDYRLSFLKPRVLERAKAKWVDGSTQAPNHVDRILDVRQGDVCFVVGNLYCAMPLKPDVLEDLTREQWLAPQPVRSKFVHLQRDEVYIEDQSGRVKLVGSAIAGGTPLRSMLVTGAVAAVLGTETRNGDFEVVDAVFAGLPPSIGAKQEVEKDKWIAIMSGLSIGESIQSQVTIQLVTEYLTGELGDSSHIVATVIAGNSMAPPVKNEDETKTKRYGQDVTTFSPAPTLALDQFLTDLCSAMPVHLLPGEKDPASAALPQQPIHFALLPRAGKFDSLHRQTNPTFLGLNGRTILGTSGQNIDDIFKYVEEGDDKRIEMALRTVEWSHLAPTAPDTLWCYPFKTSDPFVIKQPPDLLFIGNQPSYATATYEQDLHQCRVVLIPPFHKTHQIVLVNLGDLSTKLVQVGTHL